MQRTALGIETTAGCLALPSPLPRGAGGWWVRGGIKICVYTWIKHQTIQIQKRYHEQYTMVCTMQCCTVYVYIYIYVLVYVCIHIYIYIERERCVYIYIHNYIHTYIYIYIHTYNTMTTQYNTSSNGQSRAEGCCKCLALQGEVAARI